MNDHTKMIQEETDKNFKNRAQTGNTSDHHHHRHHHQNASRNSFIKPSSSSNSTTSSRYRDPRIVRVSKALGGSKDRHSKVCTVRGLRDRRVRLSVPTAIQLYDLQERLGLNQPSKVVDWLLNAAKHEIDELPPLQIPQGAFSTDQNLLNFHDFRASQLGKQGLKNIGEHSRSNFYREKSKDDEISDDRHGNWARNSQEERQFHHLENDNNNTYNSFSRLDPSNLTLFQHEPPRISHNNISGQHEDWHNIGLLPMQVPTVSTGPSASHHHHHHQVVMYHHQPGLISTPWHCPNTQISATNINGEFDPKQVNFQS